MPDEKLYVIPEAGMSVRIPESRQHLPEKGAYVSATQYWHRRIADRDVRVGRPPKQPKAGEKS